jgi:hypothetical protein
MYGTPHDDRIDGFAAEPGIGLPAFEGQQVSHSRAALTVPSSATE